ncbi:MAG: MFS transporter [Actinobacteria bacterium]|nr:MFS transporter [Actinomycetota bacterium]
MHSYETLDRPGGFDRSNVLLPLKVRDFRLLWTGMAVSLLGDGIFLVAIAWQAYALSNVPTALSLVGLAVAVPHIAFLLIGGVISDRFQRRKVMLAADIVRGLSIATVAVLSLSGSLTLAQLVGLSAVYGAGTAFFGPAFDAIVPDIVPEKLFPAANSLDQLMKPLALRMIGPAVGGWLIAGFGVGTAFAVDAATFGVSAAALLMMNVSRIHRERDESVSVLDDMRAGYSFVRKHVWLWGSFLAATFAYLLFMGPAEVLLPYMLKNDLNGSAADLGLVFAMGGVGAIGAALLVGRFGIPGRNMTFIYVTWTLATLAVAGYGIATLPWHLMVASFFFHSLETAGTIVWMTTKQRHVPAALLGRVSSFDWLISTALLPLSFALTGPVSALIGPRTTLVGAGLLGGAITLGALFLPGMRSLERRPAGDRGAKPPVNVCFRRFAAPEIRRCGPGARYGDTHGANRTRHRHPGLREILVETRGRQGAGHQGTL